MTFEMYLAYIKRRNYYGYYQRLYALLIYCSVYLYDVFNVLGQRHAYMSSLLIVIKNE